MKYKYIFVIVTYKNANDLYDFNKSLKELNESYKVIMVDNFYSEEYHKKNKKIAHELKYDYILADNKGYGSGNNIGIKKALDNYSFDYLIVCNSDIIIEKFDDLKLLKKNVAFGPKINTLNNKSQNPYWVRSSKILNYFMYIGKKKNKKLFKYINIVFNKINREIFLKINKNNIKKVSALHGAFIGFSSDVIKKCFPLFDEKMFLYNEEAYLSTKFQRMKIDCIYYPLIKIIHKEDGSTNGKPINIDKWSNESFIYYYEKYVKNIK